MRNFIDALPADAAQRLRNLKRRQRYRQNLDRPKVWPGDRLAGCRWGYRQPDAVIDAWHATLAQPEGTAAYVTAWCRLNHLLEA
jgi:hypothetical protein